MTTLFGIDIIENPHLPVSESNFRLSPDVPLTDLARARHQAWIDDFFGRHLVFYMVQRGAFGFGADGRVIVTNPANVLKLRAAIPEGYSQNSSEKT